MDVSSFSEKKFEFPDCWNDDVRMNGLFAPFRLKSVNPTSWDSKMKFWADLIESWCKYNNSPIIKISNLKKSFSRKGIEPACLEEVLQYLSSKGVLINKDSFMVPNENWTSWTFQVLTSPLKWTFNTVKKTIIKQKEQKEICYIHFPVVKHMSEELKKNISMSWPKIIFTTEDLLHWGYATFENLSVALHWMQKQRLIAFSQEDEAVIIKLSKNETDPVKITETDVGIYNLERYQKLLSGSIAQLEIKRDFALEETKRHLVAKMKNKATVSLCRKKQIEKIIEKQTATLENIENILHSIQEVKFSEEIIDVYQKGLAALNQMHKNPKMNPEYAEDTMDELKRVLNMANKTTDVLTELINPEMEKMLDDELNELLLSTAPEVPKDELKKETVKEKNKSKEAEEVVVQLATLNI